MSQFEPRPDSLITSEMLRQNFVPDVDEVLRIIHMDESATGTDTTISLGTAAICIASAGGILALSGLTAPILLPLAGISIAGISAWNSRVTQRDRQTEADFLEDHPEIMAAVEAKANQGEDAYKIANAFESAFRAYVNGVQPQLKPSAPTAAAIGEAVKTCSMCQHFKSGQLIPEFKTQGAPELGMCEFYNHPTTADSQMPARCAGFKPMAIGAATQLGAIPVQAEPVAVPQAIAAPETYPMASREVSKDDRVALIARLKEDCPLLLKLVKSHPIRAVGAQRTGKTTLVKRLALLRMVLLPGHQVIASTPHYEAANPYPNVFKVVGVTTGGKRDYPSIEQEWQSLAARVDSCQFGNATTVWDEFGLFDKVMDEERIKRVLTSALRETMKFGEYPVFIVHGETAAFLPGSKGLVTVFLNSTVRVETIGEPVEDDMGLETIKPTGKFNVTWLDGTREDGQIPAWLTEQYLLGLIGDRPAQSAPKVEQPQEEREAPQVTWTRKQSKKQMTQKVNDEWLSEPSPADILMVKRQTIAYYDRLLNEKPETKPEVESKLAAAQQAQRQGRDREALAILLSPPMAKSKTQFCGRFGHTGGGDFIRFGAVYDWVMGATVND